MMRVTVMAAVLKEITSLTAALLEEALLRGPVPRRVSILILRCLPFTTPPPPVPPPHYATGYSAAAR